MTKRDIVRQRANAFGEGVALAVKGGILDTEVLRGLIQETYMTAFEDGIVFAQWGEFPGSIYDIKTDAAFYEEYEGKNLKTVEEND